MAQGRKYIIIFLIISSFSSQNLRYIIQKQFNLHIKTKENLKSCISSVGGQLAAMCPLQIWLIPPAICDISKKHMLINPLNNVPHTTPSPF
jgi:hypothetical protein